VKEANSKYFELTWNNAAIGKTGLHFFCNTLWKKEMKL